MARQTGLTKRVREEAARRETFTARDLNNALDIRTYQEAALVRLAIKGLRKRGDIRSVSRGVYEYTPRPRRRTKLDIIWHLARSSRHFSTDDMERLSGAANETVREYLQCLVKFGFLVKTSLTTWKLVHDPGPDTPVNVAKCERLRKHREKNGTGDPASN